MKRKKQLMYGRRSYNATLTEAQVLTMRRSTMPNSYFARIYGINAETCRRARTGETWSWLNEGLDQQEENLAPLAPVADAEVQAETDREMEESKAKLKRLLGI